MAGAIGDTLPLALGVALNPPAILAVILLAAPAGGRFGALLFALGWLLGLAALLVLATTAVASRLASIYPRDSAGWAVGTLALGVVLVAAATRQLLRSGAEEASTPRWLAAVEGASTGRAFGIGVFLATVSLKNVVLLAAAAIVGQAQLGLERTAIAVAVFLVVCSLGILAPLLVRGLGGPKGIGVLADWRERLVRSADSITAVVMLLLGGNLIGRSIEALF